VVTIGEPGIYSLDVITGALVRIGDAAPFDVATDHVLTVRGGDVVATPAGGGPSSVRYTYPLVDGERLEWIKAAPDGTALLRTAKPEYGGSTLNFALVSRTGVVRTKDLVGSEFEWSGDGSVLVVFNWQGATGVRPDGTTAWGPLPAPESLISAMRVSHDGSYIVGGFNANKAKALEVASGQWSDVGAIWPGGSFGTGRRLLAQQAPPPNWSGFGAVAVVVFDPVTGAVQPYASGGSEPVWAPDEGHAVLLGEPLDHKTTSFGNYSFTVRDRVGTARWTLSAPGHRFGRDNDSHGGGVVILGPQWTSDSRYLVVGVS
jgi:hypothetical protein